MKRFIAKYMLYIYLNFIKEENLTIYKKWVLPIIKIMRFLNSIYVWTASVLFFPIFVIGMLIEEKENNIRK